LVVGSTLLKVQSVSAEGVGETSDQAGVSARCDLGPPITISVDARRKAELLRGATIERTQGNDSCQLQVSLAEGRSAVSQLKRSETCIVEVEPDPDAPDPTVVQRQSGDCSGVGVSIRISQLPPSDGQVLELGALGQHWMDARTIALDPPSFPMLIVSAQINWQYDGVNVYPISYPIYRANPVLWPFPSSFWDLVLAYSFHTIHSPGLLNVYSIEHYHYTAWHSDGFPSSIFPDTDAWIEPTAWGLGNGGVICEYYHQWSYHYPDTSFQDSCANFET
ncbi:MAG: hypothetical protein KC479_10235, partial [Dehalococcoidia bacterium]|nr:hypothetical protein [Dehalococcoidia bacterium]